MPKIVPLREVLFDAMSRVTAALRWLDYRQHSISVVLKSSNPQKCLKMHQRADFSPSFLKFVPFKEAVAA